MAASNCTAPGGGDSAVRRELGERRELPESSGCYWVVTGGGGGGSFRASPRWLNWSCELWRSHRVVEESP